MASVTTSTPQMKHRKIFLSGRPSLSPGIFFLDPNWTLAPVLQLFTDASGTLGFGGYWLRWLLGWCLVQPGLPPHLLSMPIEWKELYTIVIACEAWGHHWSGKAILEVWESGLSSRPDLLRALFFITAHNNFTVIVKHIRGLNNSIADSLSRQQLSRFRSLVPHADLAATPIPAKLTFS